MFLPNKMKDNDDYTRYQDEIFDKFITPVNKKIQELTTPGKYFVAKELFGLFSLAET